MGQVRVSRIVLLDVLLENSVAVGVTQLPEGFCLDLADSLASHIKDLSDLLQRLHPSVVQAV